MDTRTRKDRQECLRKRPAQRMKNFAARWHVFIDARQIADALTFLRDEYQFSLLSAMTAVDYWPQENPRFFM